jgi:hypothetical protein
MGIQPLYETLGEMLEVAPDMSEAEKEEHEDTLEFWDHEGFVKSIGTFLFVYIDPKQDDYIIIDEPEEKTNPDLLP